MAKHRITHTTPNDSTGSFWMPKILAKFHLDHFQRGRQI